MILFGKNAPSAAAVRALTRSIQRAGREGALVTTDQEGGSIRSLAFTDELGDLRPLGVNVNLAPVADVASVPGSVMAGRAFPGDAPAVARATRSELAALRRARLAATVKHFPGLGRATENTDDAPVTIAATREELDAVDLEPFRAAIAAGVPLVMASHALYPALDPAAVASQSQAVLEDLLRDELGFDGVVVTDSLEAQAVLARSTVEVAAERSLAAGADLLLMTGQASWNSVFPHLLRRARRSPAMRARIAESAARVRALKKRLGLRVSG